MSGNVTRCLDEVLDKKRIRKKPKGLNNSCLE
jgi:hypothetical protein